MIELRRTAASVHVVVDGKSILDGNHERVLNILAQHLLGDTYMSSYIKPTDICITEVPFQIKRTNSCDDDLLDSYIPRIRSKLGESDQRLLDLVHHHAVSKCAAFTGSNHSDLCVHTAEEKFKAQPAANDPPQTINFPNSNFQASLMDVFTLQLRSCEEMNALRKLVRLMDAKIDSVLVNQDLVYSTSAIEKAKDICFISHTGKHKQLAVLLHFVLEFHGIKTFLDIRDITEENCVAIYSAIKSCATFLIVATSDFSTSQWCMRELGAAEILSSRIVCFRPDELLLNQFPGNSNKGDLHDRLSSCIQILDQRLKITKDQVETFMAKTEKIVWTRTTLEEWRNEITNTFHLGVSGSDTEPEEPEVLRRRGKTARKQ